MSLSENYSLSNDLGSIYLLQANGQSVSGATSPSGISNRLFINDGVLQTTVYDTDPLTALGQRAEIALAPNARSEYWYVWEFMVADIWAHEITIMQIHDSPDGGDNPRCPNFMLTCQNTTVVPYTPLAALPTEGQSLNPRGGITIVPGSWNRACLRVNWQIDNTGFREFSINDRFVFRDFNTATHYNDVVGPYMKLGVYNYNHAEGFGVKTAFFRNLKVWSGNDGYSQVLGNAPAPPRRLLLF